MASLIVFAVWDTAALMALCGVIGAAAKPLYDIVAAYFKHKEGRREHQRVTRKDALQEAWDHAERIEERLEQVEKIASDCQKERLVEVRRMGQLELENERMKGAVGELQTQLRRVQEMTGTAPQTVPCVIMADLDGRIVEFTPFATILLGWPRKDVIGKNVSLLIPERDRERHLAAMAKVKANGGMKAAERTLAGFAMTAGGRELAVSILLRPGELPGTVVAEITRQPGQESTPPAGLAPGAEWPQEGKR